MMMQTLSQALMPLAHTVIMLTLVIAAIVVVIAIPSLLVPGAQPDRVGKAIACELLRALGILLATVAASPVLFNLVSGHTLPAVSLQSFLLTFVVGLLILIIASQGLEGVDHASKAVPVAVFGYTFELLGILVTLASLLLLGLTAISRSGVPNGWEVPATALIIGLVYATVFSLHTSNHRRSAPRSSGSGSFVSSLKKAVRRVVKK